MSIFEVKNNKKRSLFFGDSVDIVRYDNIKFPFIHGINEQQMGYFWRPQEIEIYKDRADFKKLTSAEQRIFTSNLKRQTLLDSVQERGPALLFLSLCSTPEMENWVTTWPFFEQIHNRTYQYIIEGVYADATPVFDGITELEPIVDCARDIVKYYDDLILWNAKRVMWENGLWPDYNEYEHKRSFWRALIAVNVLEGIRFYVSFACSWAFAETNRMEGNATLIKLICRDENLHLGVTQHLIKALPKQDPDFARIREEDENESIQIFIEAAEQEMIWGKYLFEDGSMLGLNETVLNSFIKWRTNKVLQGAGYPKYYDVPAANPLAWTQRWISGNDVQTAPQETQITQYEVGAVKQDVTDDFLTSLKL